MRPGPRISRWLLLASALILAGCGDAAPSGDRPAKPTAEDETESAEFRAWRQRVERRCSSFERYLARMPDPEAGLEDVRGPKKLRAVGARLMPVAKRYLAFADDVQSIPPPRRGFSIAVEVSAAFRQRGKAIRTTALFLKAADVEGLERWNPLEVETGKRLEAAGDKAGLTCGAEQ